MLVSIHQPNFLPYPGFFNKIATSDVFVIYDTAQYVKDRWDNRNQIKANTGQKIYLTIPLQKKGSYQKRLVDVLLPVENKWKEKHLNSIKAHYGKSYYFKKYFNEIESLYNSDLVSFSEFSFSFIMFFAKVYNIKTRMVKASELDTDKSLFSTEALVEIIKIVGGDSYLSGPSGPNYMDYSHFANSNIEVKIQTYQSKPYRQLHGKFIPNLSTMDLLLNEGKNGKNYI